MSNSTINIAECLHPIFLSSDKYTDGTVVVANTETGNITASSDSFVFTGLETDASSVNEHCSTEVDSRLAASPVTVDAVPPCPEISTYSTVSESSAVTSSSPESVVPVNQDTDVTPKPHGTSGKDPVPAAQTRFPDFLEIRADSAGTEDNISNGSKSESAVPAGQKTSQPPIYQPLYGEYIPDKAFSPNISMVTVLLPVSNTACFNIQSIGSTQARPITGNPHVGNVAIGGIGNLPVDSAGIGGIVNPPVGSTGIGGIVNSPVGSTGIVGIGIPFIGSAGICGIGNPPVHSVLARRFDYTPARGTTVSFRAGIDIPATEVAAPMNTLPKIKAERIPERYVERLIREHLLLKVQGEPFYFINPLIVPFLNITDVKSLRALNDSDDENIRMYREVARCFHVENNGDVDFNGNTRFDILVGYLDSQNSKKAVGAQRIVEELYGKEMDVESLERNVAYGNWEKVDLLHLRAHTTSATCPVCGNVSYKRCDKRGTFTRFCQDVPLRPGRPLVVKITGGRQYYCTNPECTKCKENETFHEQFSCLRPQQQRTTRLDALLLSCVIDTSFHGCERVMDLYGIKVGDDSVRKIVRSLNFPDDPDITAIGVDDVAYRKGVSYLTAIYSLSDHRLLALLEGRDGVKLEEWLDQHPKVKVICRDRASAYAVHIDEWARRHGCTVLQVADRFHLVKNYIDHLRDISCKYLPKSIAFNTKTGEILSSVPNKIAQAVGHKPTDEVLEDLPKYDNTHPSEENGELDNLKLSDDHNDEESSDENESNSSEKPSDATKGKSNSRQKTAKQQEKETEAQNKRNKKYDTICKIRNEFDPSGSKTVQYKELAQKHEKSIATVMKYIGMSQEEVENTKLPVHRNVTQRSKEIDDYKYIIYKMLKDGHDVDMVFWYIKGKGYRKSDSNLMEYILVIYRILFPNRIQPRASKYIKLVYPDDVEVIPRTGILKYLVTVNPHTSRNQFLLAHENEFLEKYPRAKIMRDAFLEFHGVIMGDSVEALERLCNKECPLPELASFFQHLLNEDMDAVSNAIRYSYSSGFVEGNNNKFKVVKRISYGRLRLATLIKKCMLAFLSTLDDFELGKVVKWVPLRDNTEYVESLVDDILV